MDLQYETKRYHQVQIKSRNFKGNHGLIDLDLEFQGHIFKTRELLLSLE